MFAAGIVAGSSAAGAPGSADVTRERSASEGGRYHSRSKAAEIRDGEGVLRAMHDRYAKDWYETLTFTQKSTTHKPDGTNSSETWFESALLPGKLRIDIGPASDGNGMLVADGTLTMFKGGQVTGSRPLVHMLLVLGFDVYKQTPEATIAQEKGCTPSQLALAWLLAKGDDILPIPGTKRRKYLEQNAAAAEIHLSAAENERLEEVAPMGVASGLRYPEAMMKRVNG